MGERIVFLGYARANRAAVALASRLGAEISILDENPVANPPPDLDIRIGRARKGDLSRASVVVASPGIPPHHLWIQEARAAGIPVWSDIELAYKAGIRPVISVTGTNGKTTTTRMIQTIMNAHGMEARAAGNIGDPLCEFSPEDLIVSEVSSFQLEYSEEYKSPVSLLINIAPDHLDWHQSMQNYIAAKEKLFKRMEESHTAILEASLWGSIDTGKATVRRFSSSGKRNLDAFIWKGVIYLGGEALLPVADLSVPYLHFAEDAMAAALAGWAVGIPQETILEGLRAFRPDPHRMELVAEFGGVRWINDSKATDPHAAASALKAVEAPVILIAGGLNKGLEFSDLLSAGRGKLSAVIAFGAAREEISDAMKQECRVISVEGLDEAVHEAACLAEPGTTVVFSPACASFDQFKNYEHRGEEFKRLVRELL